MRVLVLLHSDLIPPDECSDSSQLETADWKTEFQVVQALRQLKHQVFILGVKSELGEIRRALYECKPHIVFNLLEEFAGEAIFDQHVVSYLEMMKVKYTGCNPRGLTLARDKALAKKIFRYHRISTPDFFVLPRGKTIRLAQNLRFPIIVKSRTEEASMGLTQGNLVHTAQELKSKANDLHEELASDVLCESYISGRELYSSIIGNDTLKVLPTWELYLDQLSPSAPRFATSKVKWDFAYRKKYGVRTGEAKALSADQVRRVERLCKRVYRALELSGYARIDLRMTDEGELFVLEANPNPDIGDNEDMAAAAGAREINYPSLIKKILDLGLRWHPR